MRITNSMMVSKFLSDANSSLSRVSKYQNQVDSTKKVVNISDDPQATMIALKARNKLSDLDTYQSNINKATSYLTEAETAANALDEIMQCVYEEVVSATGGTKSQSELDIIADELTSLQQEIVSIGNTSVGTCFIFGGYNFTGTTDGVRTTAPFSVDEATGHLIYNDIDLSQISWAEDYKMNTALMASYSSTISADSTALAATSSDDYARGTLCADALDALENMVTSGKAALNAAKEFGIDSSSTAYQNLSAYVSSISDTVDDLSNECSKKLAGDYILESDASIYLTSGGEIDYDYYREKDITVMTADEYANCFSRTTAQSILSMATELIYNSDTTSGVGLNYSMTEATSELKTAIDAALTASGAETAIADEADNQALLRIGTTQSVEYTFTGTQLLGFGGENAYHVLNKCISMLKNGDTGGLSKMISEVQDMQSNVLSFEAKIGETENRMSRISSRYSSSSLNYTEMQSNAIDVDMAEAITNFTTAKTVYSAALAAGGEIIQTSLIDFLK